MSTLLQDRYGRPTTPGRRRLLLALAALALAAALAFIGWVTLLQGPSLHWDDIGYHVQSDAEIEVTFDVGFIGSSGSEQPSADCTVQALNALRSEVGLQDVRVQAGPGGRARTTVTVQTSERAATGLVKSCSRVN
jgi:uncharacterized protein DUF4307